MAPRFSMDGLAVGMWVEAKGRPDVGAVRVDEVTQLQRSVSDSADKVEITAPLEKDAEGGELLVLGQRVKIGSSTVYEDSSRNEIAAFPLIAGDWLKIKTRVRSSGGLRSRGIRKVEPGGRFTVEGEVSSYDADNGILEIGPLPLRLAANPRIELLSQFGRATRGDPLALFIEDDQKAVPFTLRPFDHVFIGGQVAFKSEFNDEFDLNRERDRDRSKFREEAKLDLLWTMGDGQSFVFLEGKYTRNDQLRDGRANTHDDDGSLSRAYAYLRYSDLLRIQIGRQDFDEEREWLYDEVLDGLRLRSSWQAWDLEISASIGKEILHEANSTDDTALYAGIVRYHLNEDHHLSAYILKRTDSDRDDFEPLLYGLRSYAKPWRGLGHWAELALAAGKDGDQSIRGSAVDVGLLYRFDHPWRPTIVAGYAFASGEDDASSDVGFRQTGLQDNNGKFGGVTSFKYYGEALEPELANLEVTTVGVGIRPYQSFSLDLLWHGYRMDVAKFALQNSNLRTMTNGASRDIGWGVDLVAGYRYYNRMSAELIVGHFVPGRAFDRDDAASKLELQIRMKF